VASVGECSLAERFLRRELAARFRPALGSGYKKGGPYGRVTLKNAPKKCGVWKKVNAFAGNPGESQTY